MGVITLETPEDFHKQLKDAGDKLVVVDCFATWCGPCKMIAPYLEELSNTYSNAVFLKIDVDELEDLAAELDVSSMPTFLFYKNSKKVETVIGASRENLKAAVVKHQG